VQYVARTLQRARSTRERIGFAMRFTWGALAQAEACALRARDRFARFQAMRVGVWNREAGRAISPEGPVVINNAGVAAVNVCF